VIEPGETIEIVKKGALHPGERGAVLDVRSDGRVEARFRAGKFTVDRGEFAVIERAVGDTVEIVKDGALRAGARGVIEQIRKDGDVEARFDSGNFTVKGGEYVVVT
jgi:hypothetical protein